MEYIITYKDKRFDVWHTIIVRDYGAKLLCELLKENGYEFTCRETPEPYKKEYNIDKLMKNK